MTNDKWQEIIGRIKDDFEVLEVKKEKLEDEPGEVEFISFISPVGKVKLERTVKPLVLEQKGRGSRRIGSQVTIEKVYSETEKVDILKAYKFNEDSNDWEEIEVEKAKKFVI